MLYAKQFVHIQSISIYF